MFVTLSARFQNRKLTKDISIIKTTLFGVYEIFQIDGIHFMMGKLYLRTR